MALPERVRVRLSSEAAGAISITPVVVQEMAMGELLEHMLAVIGKQQGRLHDALRRGSLLSGASRFRWEGFEAGDAELAALLASFPDPDPARPFAASRCTRAVLRGARHALEISPALARPRLFSRGDFWNRLMQVAAAAAPRYLDYSYRDRADLYHAELSPQAAETLRAAASSLRHADLRGRIRAAPLSDLDLFVPR